MRIGDFWQARTASIHRWPAPEQKAEQGETNGGEEEPAERHTFSGDHMLRMIRRMARALVRLGAGAGDTACIPPIATPEHLALWMACLVQGVRPLLANVPNTALPDTVKAVICLPEQKAAFAPLAGARGAKMATLGGHWRGSFFMLQMVQPETPTPGEAADTPPETLFASATGDAPMAASFTRLLEQAAAFRERHAAALDAAPALLLAIPAVATPASMAALLAALLENRPLYWLAPGEEKRGWKQAAELPPGTLALLEEGARLPARAADHLRSLTLPRDA